MPAQSRARSDRTRAAAPVKGAVAGTGTPPTTPPPSAARAASRAASTKKRTTPEKRAVGVVAALGADALHAEAEAALERLAGAQAQLAEESSIKRELVAQYEDAEAELSAETRAKQTDMSQTAFEKHIKTVIHADPNLKDGRMHIRQATDRIEALEFEVRHAEREIHVKVARLEEIAGRLRYYGAVKETK